MTNNLDTDLQVLKQAYDAAYTIDVRYKLASVNEKWEMKQERDSYFNAYGLAKLNLLKDGVVTTQADVDKMKAIRKEVEKAVDTSALIGAILKGVGFLVRFAL